MHTNLITDSSPLFIVGSDFNGNPPTNEHVSNNKWHNKSGDLLTVKRDGRCMPTFLWTPGSCYAALYHFVETVPIFLAQQKNFNSPGNQQDAIIPSLWVAFHTAPCHMDKAPWQQQSQEVAERLSSAEKLCLAAVEKAWSNGLKGKFLKWPNRKQATFSLPYTKKKDGNAVRTRKMHVTLEKPKGPFFPGKGNGMHSHKA